MRDSDEAEVPEVLREQLPPALERLLNSARAATFSVAAGDGYGPDEAEWMEAYMRQPLLQRIVDRQPVEAAFQEAYRLARRALLVEIFERALNEGADRAAAFRRLIALECAMANRRNEPEPTYTQALVDAGCAAALAAAAQGGSIEQQIDTGFAMMRDLARFEPIVEPHHG